jgi:hypothetical protein
MRVVLTDELLEIRLARWEKILGLMGDVRVARSAVKDAEVLGEPLRAVRGSGLKAGLRLPGVYYVARSLRLDEAWILRRGLPALAFSIDDGRTLRRVTVTTSDAEELARQLGSG